MDLREGPAVSVIVATKDRWSKLRLAVRSALAQTIQDIEVIVVDDGSRDRTPEGLAAIDDSRLVMVRHASSQGVARARNAALARAGGRWVAFLDDDDLWAPEKLQRQLAVAAETGADFLSTHSLRVRADGVVFGRMEPRIEELERALLRFNFIGGPSTVMVAADLLDSVGGFDEQLSVIADWELWLRLARLCKPAVVDEALVAVLQHGDNMHVTASAQVAAELRHMASIHADRIASLGGAFGSPMLSESLAHNERRAGHSGRAARAYLGLALHHRPVRSLVRVLVCATEAVIGRPLPARPSRAEPAPEWLAEALRASEGA